jgi:hypothetical protein
MKRLDHWTSFGKLYAIVGRGCKLLLGFPSEACCRSAMIMDWGILKEFS